MSTLASLLGFSPIQDPNAVPPQQQSTSTIPPDLLKKLIQLRGPSEAAAQAQALQELEDKRTPSLAAAGRGPLGIRAGEGPNGWAISLGDAVGGIAQTLKNRGTRQAEEMARANLAAQAAPTMEDFLNFYRNGGKSQSSQAQPVQQGTPMTSHFPMAF